MTSNIDETADSHGKQRLSPLAHIPDDITKGARLWVGLAMLFVPAIVVGGLLTLSSVHVSQMARGYGVLDGTAGALAVKLRINMSVPPREGEQFELLLDAAVRGCTHGIVVRVRSASHSRPVIVDGVLEDMCARRRDAMLDGFAVGVKLPDRSLLSVLWPG